MKIKLSKSQWEGIGKKAGWYSEGEIDLSNIWVTELINLKKMPEQELRGELQKIDIYIENLLKTRPNSDTPRHIQEVSNEDDAYSYFTNSDRSRNIDGLKNKKRVINELLSPNRDKMVEKIDKQIMSKS